MNENLIAQAEDAYACVLDHPHLSADDYDGDRPRWCQGCGDRAILGAVQGLLEEEQTPPEDVVCISGIGCSSRFPYYIGTYGFHGIHGRALPISEGVSIARPDLKVITVMGDGDCFSIGAGHWLHSLRYNANLTVLVFDNEIYALTKKQASPTTPVSTTTQTTPGGAFLHPLNPLSVVMGMTQTSFLAQTASWLPAHLAATIRAGMQHRGLSFIRILQRCPVFSPDVYISSIPPGQQSSDEQTVHKPTLMFLEHEKGIALHKSLDRIIVQHGIRKSHDPYDRDKAVEMASFGATATSEEKRTDPIGLLYIDPQQPVYGDILTRDKAEPSPEEKVDLLNAELDRYSLDGTSQ